MPQAPVKIPPGMARLCDELADLEFDGLSSRAQVVTQAVRVYLARDDVKAALKARKPAG